MLKVFLLSLIVQTLKVMPSGLKGDIKKLFVAYKKKRMYKKGDYTTAIKNFTQAMLVQDYEQAQILNAEIQGISRQAYINDDMDCIERIAFIKTGKLPLR